MLADATAPEAPSQLSTNKNCTSSKLPLPPTLTHQTINLPYIANIPPDHYCDLYGSAASLSQHDDYQARILSAALTPLSHCAHTGIAVQSPLNAKEWAAHFLASRYPHHRAAITLVTAIRTGVLLAYRGPREGHSSGHNLPSGVEHANAVRANIDKELELQRRCGPYTQPPFPFSFANPLGVVFKKGGSKPRIIHHLSYPRNGDSVNAYIMHLEVKMKAFERAVDNLRTCGQGCYMAKIDIESAYRCIPVNPLDWPLQGMQWDGQFFFDIVMQFGLSSASAIFEYFASATEFFAKVLLFIRFLEHYIDDFLLMARTERLCLTDRDRLLAMLDKLGLPYSHPKLEGPATSMNFLGIKFDSVAMTLSLDEDKLQTLRTTLTDWMARTTGSRHELQSLCGVLNFASSVVRSGRIFFRRILDLLRSLPSFANADTQFPLSSGFHRDVRWWLDFASEWNGVTVVPPTRDPLTTLTVNTDACNTGYGALFADEWFAGKWTADELSEARREERISMPWLEFHAIVRAAATWGSKWRGRYVLVHSDCEPVVAAWAKGTSPSPGLAMLTRTLLFLAARHDFTLEMKHVPGSTNDFADWLSRDQVTRFLESSTQHSRSPTTPLPLPTLTW